MKDLLAILEQKRLHVHVLTSEDRKLIGTIAAYDPRHSHYVMDACGKVVHCGSPSSIEWFAHQHVATQQMAMTPDQQSKN